MNGNRENYRRILSFAAMQHGNFDKKVDHYNKNNYNHNLQGSRINDIKKESLKLTLNYNSGDSKPDDTDKDVACHDLMHRDKEDDQPNLVYVELSDDSNHDSLAFLNDKDLNPRRQTDYAFGTQNARTIHLNKEQLLKLAECVHVYYEQDVEVNNNKDDEHMSSSPQNIHTISEEDGSPLGDTEQARITTTGCTSGHQKGTLKNESDYLKKPISEFCQQEKPYSSKHTSDLTKKSSEIKLDLAQTIILVDKPDGDENMTNPNNENVNTKLQDSISKENMHGISCDHTRLKDTVQQLQNQAEPNQTETIQLQQCQLNSVREHDNDNNDQKNNTNSDMPDYSVEKATGNGNQAKCMQEVDGTRKMSIQKATEQIHQNKDNENLGKNDLSTCEADLMNKTSCGQSDSKCKDVENVTLISAEKVRQQSYKKHQSSTAMSLSHHTVAQQKYLHVDKIDQLHAEFQNINDQDWLMKLGRKTMNVEKQSGIQINEKPDNNRYKSKLEDDKKSESNVPATSEYQSYNINEAWQCNDHNKKHSSKDKKELSAGAEKTKRKRLFSGALTIVLIISTCLCAVSGVDYCIRFEQNISSACWDLVDEADSCEVRNYAKMDDTCCKHLPGKSLHCFHDCQSPDYHTHKMIACITVQSIPSGSSYEIKKEKEDPVTNLVQCDSKHYEPEARMSNHIHKVQCTNRKIICSIRKREKKQCYGGPTRDDQCTCLPNYTSSCDSPHSRHDSCHCEQKNLTELNTSSAPQPLMPCPNQSIPLVHFENKGKKTNPSKQSLNETYVREQPALSTDLTVEKKINREQESRQTKISLTETVMIMVISLVLFILVTAMRCAWTKPTSKDSCKIEPSLV